MRAKPLSLDARYTGRRAKSMAGDGLSEGFQQTGTQLQLSQPRREIDNGGSGSKIMTTEITINDRELTVHGAEYFPPSRGYRNSMGVPEEPDEAGWWDWDFITDEDGKEVELSDEELDQVDEKLESEASNGGSW